MDAHGVRVSVIISTYNRPSQLMKVIEGLDLQRRLPDEVVIADDGSGPETKEAVEKAAGNAPFPVIHIWHEDMGFRAAKIRNLAIEKSSGDYLIFLDGDCVPDRHFISDHLCIMERGFFIQGKRVLLSREASESFQAACANSVLKLLRLALLGRASNSHHIFRVPFFTFRSRSLRGIKGCNMGAFRADVLGVNGFDEEFTGWGREDSEFAARLYKYGLMRKSHPFRAVCFHLWHEALPRENLRTNEELLERTILSADFRSRNGIIKG